jgi:hypothetical protein
MSERFVGDGRPRLSGRWDACPTVGDTRRCDAGSVRADRKQERTFGAVPAHWDSVSHMASADGYELLGHGPSATGPGPGCRMRADLSAKCLRCGDMVSLDPDETATFSCGGISKDADAGRFGSSVGDEGIAIYRLR